MRTGIFITVCSSDRFLLERLVRERNAAQKHVWRAAMSMSATKPATMLAQKPASYG
jgi:hypothetical protein